MTSNNNWIGDGSDGSLAIDGSGIITLTSAKRGTPFNIRLDDSTISSSASLFYEIEITELTGHLAVGLVTESEFKAGWKTKGMFYNGNLTNGSAGLLIGFGSHPKAGDKVGVYLQRSAAEAQQLQVIFYLNGRCLGSGFRLDANKATFYPCLHLDGNAIVKYTAVPEHPTVTTREVAQHADAYSGDWILKQAFSGPELGEFPLPQNNEIVVSFQAAEPNTYRVGFKVGNRMNTQLTITGKMEAFDKIEVGHVMSTRMMPPPELFEVEKFLSKSLPGLFKMIVNNDGQDLVMTGTDAELRCSRYEKVFEPLTKY